MRTFSLWMLLLAQSLLAAEPQRSSVDGDGTVHVPAFAIPLSRYMSEQPASTRRRRARAGARMARPDEELKFYLTGDQVLRLLCARARFNLISVRSDQPTEYATQEPYTSHRKAG
jgi:hypothetical protein